MSLPGYTNIKPPTQECPICMENVDPDDITTNGIPNCVTCENLHFLHRQCFDKMTKRECPLCRKPVIYNCSSYHGYRIRPTYNTNTGGYYKRKKRNKTKNKRTKSKKSKRNKNKSFKKKSKGKYI
jgi:hypothetical protein